MTHGDIFENVLEGTPICGGTDSDTPLQGVTSVLPKEPQTKDKENE